MTAEHDRLDQARTGQPWRRWGPYLSERQWGTVREDQSANGDAWSSFTHDQARSRQYQWGEDGLAGFRMTPSKFCLGLALWNGVDPILKERLSGLTNAEGNHGEDVKEYYFYLDATPTHSYLRYLYKYPLSRFPYTDLVAVNSHRSRTELEYELLETGVFDGDRYVDVEVEFAKAAPEDVCCEITVHNPAAEPVRIHVLPQLWFRATWLRLAASPRPTAYAVDSASGSGAVRVERLYGLPNPQPYVKDAFHRFLVEAENEVVNPERRGTKVAAHCVLAIPALDSAKLR